MEKLEELIKLRLEVAHEVRTDKRISKARVYDFVHFIERLAAISSNRVGSSLSKVGVNNSFGGVGYGKRRARIA